MRKDDSHRHSLTQKLDDRDNRNWIEDDELLEHFSGSKSPEHLELLEFLMGLGDNENLRGEYVEKDGKGRNVEVSIVGKYAVYYHLDNENQSVRVLKIIPAADLAIEA